MPLLLVRSFRQILELFVAYKPKRLPTCPIWYKVSFERKSCESLSKVVSCFEKKFLLVIMFYFCNNANYFFIFDDGNISQLGCCW